MLVYLLTCCRRSLADKTMTIRRCHYHQPLVAGVVLRHGFCRRSPGQRRECTSTAFRRASSAASSTTSSPWTPVPVPNTFPRLSTALHDRNVVRWIREQGQFPSRTLVHPIASSALPPYNGCVQIYAGGDISRESKEVFGRGDRCGYILVAWF